MLAVCLPFAWLALLAVACVHVVVTGGLHADWSLLSVPDACFIKLNKA